MALESIRIMKSEDLPPETLAEHDLPKESFIEVRMESHSDPSPKFEILTEEKMDDLWKKLKEKNLLL